MSLRHTLSSLSLPPTSYINTLQGLKGITAWLCIVIWIYPFYLKPCYAPIQTQHFYMFVENAILFPLLYPKPSNSINPPRSSLKNPNYLYLTSIQSHIVLNCTKRVRRLCLLFATRLQYSFPFSSPSFWWRLAIPGVPWFVSAVLKSLLPCSLGCPSIGVSLSSHRFSS